MVLIALHFFLCTLHYFSSHTGIKLNPLICFMTRKNRRHQSKDDFWGQRFKQHIILWGLPNRSASMQSTILLYAAGTSYDLRGKFPFQFQKGGGQWATYVWFSSFTQRKKHGGQLGLFTKFDNFKKRFFSRHLGQKRTLHIVGHMKNRAKKSKIKKHCRHYFTIQGHSAVLFLAQQLIQQSLK